MKMIILNVYWAQVYINLHHVVQPEPRVWALEAQVWDLMDKIQEALSEAASSISEARKRAASGFRGLGSRV